MKALIGIAFSAVLSAQIPTTLPNTTSNPPAGAITTPISNAPTNASSPPQLLQLTYGSSGLWVIEELVRGGNFSSTVTIARDATTQKLTISGTPTPPTQVLPVTTTWVPLALATTAPTDSWKGYEVWCMPLNANGNNWTATYFTSVVTLTNTTSGTPATGPINEQGIVFLPQVSTGTFTVTSATPNTWIRNRPECNNMPAFMMTPASTTYCSSGSGATCARTSVQAVVTR